jgi:two-component system sensor histidine kinase KdpD
VVHDLRTPLASIVGFGSTLEDRWHMLSDEDRSAFLKRIVLNGHELDRRISTFLEYSRLERGELTLQCRPCHLGGAVDAAVERTRLVLERHMVLVSVPDDIAVVADDCSLTRVLENLLSNAARYSPPDTVVRVLADRTRRAVTISVEDNGPGVAPEDAGRIFEPFYRAAAAGRGTNGAGIGLAGVRQLVHLMDGKVWVETPSGGGSAFRVRLPAVPSAGVRRLAPVAFLHSAP